MGEYIQKHWHTLRPRDVISHFDSHLEYGLSHEEAKVRQQTYGLNELSQKATTGPFMRFLLQFHQPLVYIIIVAGIVTFLVGEYVDSGLIFAVVLVNALVGFSQ